MEGQDKSNPNPYRAEVLKWGGGQWYKPFLDVIYAKISVTTYKILIINVDLIKYAYFSKTDSPYGPVL